MKWGEHLLTAASLKSLNGDCCVNRKYKIIIIRTKPQCLSIDYLLFVFNNITAEFMDIIFFSPVKDEFPMGYNIKEEEWEGHIFRKENFKEPLFHVLSVKGRDQKANSNV